MNRASVSKHASVRRLRRQSELPASLMMSPDSSQSSSDSQAAWQRLTGTGQKYTTHVVSASKGKLANEDCIQKKLTQFKLARNPKPIAFKIILLMGACHLPQTL